MYGVGGDHLDLIIFRVFGFGEPIAVLEIRSCA